MFDVGFTEIVLIGIVSLIVIGPERLPAVARTVGLWVGKMQRFVRGVKTDLASELETGDLKKLIGDQREQINELRTMVSSAKKDFESTTREVVKNTKSGLADLEKTINEAKDDTSALDSDKADIKADIRADIKTEVSADIEQLNVEQSSDSPLQADVKEHKGDELPTNKTGTTGTGS